MAAKKKAPSRKAASKKALAKKGLKNVHIVDGGPVRICVLHRPSARQAYTDSRSCATTRAWSSAAEMAWSAVGKGHRATVSVQQGNSISYWDVVGDKSAKNITRKLPRLKA